MVKYKLTNEAVEDLTKIWDYTFDKWSEKQADKYYEMLLENCRRIADDPNIGKKYDGIRDELFGLKVNRHIIFYRKLNERPIEITRILHERMDLKIRLNE
ncbi:MAG: type II toxin-antitoxin system RelE/ParE family toxin [Chitinophagales bacterium]|nr:type II toxin-antitoxin system RelE/ParE family toxin [Chitinophagales bacterium]